MTRFYVIDTNVLLDASAVNNHCLHVSPDNPDLCELAYAWLSRFANSDDVLVMDNQGRIEEEYEHKLDYNDFGRQVVRQKWNRGQVLSVDLLYDDEGYAYLEEPLATVVHDHSDRKLVAAALEALKRGPCQIVNAADTDWYDWLDELHKNGIEVLQLLPGWSHDKWLEKKHP
ncbi:MAG TPA: hypothetical protein VFW42_03355 [Fluviicoccus sp.]|nr:hypothetical protein [Fluviicoccus sp.]